MLKHCLKTQRLLVFVLECFSVAVLTAQSVSQCVCRGEVSRQLEWVLLDAHFALLHRLIQQSECQAKTGIEKQPLVAKRCQALTALIRLTCIAPCEELLDMQEKVGGCLFWFALIHLFCKVDNTTELCQCFKLLYIEPP